MEQRQDGMRTGFPVFPEWTALTEAPFQLPMAILCPSSTACVIRGLSMTEEPRDAQTCRAATAQAEPPRLSDVCCVCT